MGGTDDIAVGGTDGVAADTLTRETRRLVPDESLRVDVADNGGFCVYVPP